MINEESMKLMAKLSKPENPISLLAVELERQNNKMRIAINEAIRRPLGVVPDSAFEFYEADFMETNDGK